MFVKLDAFYDLKCTAQSLPNSGTCGDCGSPAFDNVDTICKECARHYGISTFPEYTYQSELNTPNINSDTQRAKRKYFFFGI